MLDWFNGGDIRITTTIYARRAIRFLMEQWHPMYTVLGKGAVWVKSNFRLSSRRGRCSGRVIACVALHRNRTKIIQLAADRLQKTCW